ncbi:MAG: Serine/threonine-protein kinase pkn1 [Chlamydiae bacterium]|nr:Serine/threonine-protein kinase pkn1 [Chlamydiota bacterium]
MTTDTKRQIGEYLLEEPLVQGLLGLSYLSSHRFLKQPYILKVLPKGLADDEQLVALLKKEIPRITSVDHPNIAPLHDVFINEDGAHLVSPMPAGFGELYTLEQYLEIHPHLQEEEVYSILEQIASALDAAHGKHYGGLPLAHLGLNLGNVLISKESRKALLTEFGLMRLVGLSEFRGKVLHALWDGFAMGENPQFFTKIYSFLAPEQKDHLQMGPKADHFAFGALAYYMLMKCLPTGCFPFPTGLKKNWKSLLSCCLHPDPEKRAGTLLSALQAMDSAPALPSKKAAKPMLHPGKIARPEYDSDPAAAFNVDHTVAKYTPKHFDKTHIEPLLSEMVVIEGGTFSRGSNHGARDETPKHAININSFAIDIHPITNEQFILFLEALGGEKDVNNNDIVRLRDSRIKRVAGKLSIESGYAKHPVVGVTWYGASAYAEWVGGRLPTEAEWEIASYGGLESAQYPTGEGIERSQANFFSSDTTLIMSYPPNGAALYDMVGNVYEWCADWYDYNFYETSLLEPDNPTGPLQGVYRVLRGGCWKSLQEDMRCAHRHRNNPGSFNRTYGFRCAADVTE